MATKYSLRSGWTPITGSLGVRSKARPEGRRRSISRPPFHSPLPCDNTEINNEVAALLASPPLDGHPAEASRVSNRNCAHTVPTPDAKHIPRVPASHYETHLGVGQKADPNGVSRGKKPT